MELLWALLPVLDVPGIVLRKSATGQVGYAKVQASSRTEDQNNCHT